MNPSPSGCLWIEHQMLQPINHTHNSSEMRGMHPKYIACKAARYMLIEKSTNNI